MIRENVITSPQCVIVFSPGSAHKWGTREKENRENLACTLLKEHFGSMPLHNLVTASRQFPATARVDLQFALDALFTQQTDGFRFVGIHSQYGHETATFSHEIRQLSSRCRMKQAGEN